MIKLTDVGQHALLFKEGEEETKKLGGLAVKVKMAFGWCCAWFQVVSFITLRMTGRIKKKRLAVITAFWPKCYGMSIMYI